MADSENKRPKRVSSKKCCDCGKFLSRQSYMRCATCSYKERACDEDYSRNWHLKNKYGMEFGEFDGWWIAQYGRCAICKNNLRMPEKKQGQPLDVVAVDHCHITGKIRGLLCNGCNKGLGLFKDNVKLLENARKYLNA